MVRRRGGEELLWAAENCQKIAVMRGEEGLP
jgi:hypothetical protein